MTDEEFLAYCYTTATQSTHCNMVSVTLIRLAKLAGDAEAVALLEKQSIHTATDCHVKVLLWVKEARARMQA
jgi:hypothetical protein